MSLQIEKLKAFFDKEEASLKLNYPGLNWNRLKMELEVFNLRFGLNADFKKLKEQLKLGVPLEYISERAYFYHSEFLVNENVLIPRSETESLVEMALLEIKSPMKIAEVGTGSGCIPLSIACESEFPLEIIATDLSQKAIEVAKINQFRLFYRMPLNTHIKFVKTDRLAGITEKFNLIISNPPYIKEGVDRELVHNQVDKFEPHMALYLKDDEYDRWFKDFFKMVFSSLLKGGIFLMEGHEYHLNDLALLAEHSGLSNVKILPDLVGSHRFLRGIKLDN